MASSAAVSAVYDVVVVGGGVAGLSGAAAMLQSPDDLSVALLEASTSVGGRVRTTARGAAMLFEDGAAWLHGGVDPSERDWNPVAALFPPPSPAAGGSLGSFWRLIDERKGSRLLAVASLSSNPWVHPHRDVFTFLHSHHSAEAIEAVVDQAIVEHWRAERKSYEERESADEEDSEGESEELSSGPLKRYLDAVGADDSSKKEKGASVPANDSLQASIHTALNTILACWFGGDYDTIQEEDRGYALNEDNCRGDYQGCHAAVTGPKEFSCPRLASSSDAFVVRESCDVCTKVKDALHLASKGGAGMTTAIATLLHRCLESPRFSLQLDHEVKTVHYSSRSNGAEGDEDTFPITLECSNGLVIRCKHIISAIPLNVLRSGAVTFEPPLPKTFTEAMKGVASAQYKKVYLLFGKDEEEEALPLPLCKTPFLALLGDDTSDPAAKSKAEEPFFTLVENLDILKGGRYHDDDGLGDKHGKEKRHRYPAVCGILFGSGVYKNKETLEPWSDEDCVAALLSQLSTHVAASGWPPLPPLGSSHVTHWETERLTGNGAYSYLPSTVSDGEKLAADLESGCFLALHRLAMAAEASSSSSSSPSPPHLPAYLAFAGEGFHFEYMGSLHGAFLSGQQAAHKVLKAMRKEQERKKKATKSTAEKE
jgi:monoamine oxidase